MFDGLDEVSEKVLQLEIQQEIHNFIEQQRHPDAQKPTWNRFLITSRLAEYDAPALESYRYFLVAELSEEQISDYLPLWYHACSTVSGDAESARMKQLTLELLAAYANNEAVRKLADNPLLLTLMAMMLRNGTSLPERRIELYQAVVKTLLESRNEIKGLPKLYEDEAIQRLGSLAFTMQGVGNNLAHRAEVEAAIRAAIAAPSGSASTGTQTPAQVEQDVKEYIESISKRGGLFIERTNEYYGFIHRSFQEYFAARHMLREIERDRDKKIKEYVQLVRDNPNAWREPFILAVAFKSDGDGGPVATSMLRPLLNSRGKNALRDVLLTAACITEAKYINLDARLQQDTVERLLSHYEQAQKEQRFEDCGAIERAVQDWLLMLREGETYLELPHKLQSIIADGKQPARQKATLTLLCEIAGSLRFMRYNLYLLLIPSLLALAELKTVPPYTPASGVQAATDFDIADLSLALFSLMGSRGPGGLLLESTQNYFKDHPSLLRDLARYSLASGTLITPVPAPLEGESFELYSHAIGRWIKLRDSYKRTHITESNIKDCLSIQEAILNCVSEVRYPAAMDLQAMVQRAANDPARWQEHWQSYLLEQLENAPYVHYQQVALLWIMLFPEKQNLEILKDCIINHYNSSHLPQQRYSRRFLSALSIDLRDSRYLIDLRDLRDSRYLRNLRVSRILRNLEDLKDLKDLRDLRDLRYLRNLIDLKDLRDLRDLILGEDVAENARTALLSQGTSPNIDLFTIMMGRILQVQENGETGPQIEGEVQRLAAVAFDYLSRGNITDMVVYEAALDIVRSLPARTANETRFVWQVMQAATEPRVSTACLQALAMAEPQNASAWHEIEQGKTSSVQEVREVVEVVLKRRK